jgi:hypothetical protein
MPALPVRVAVMFFMLPILLTRIVRRKAVIICNDSC